MGPFTGEVLWITLTPGRTDTLMLSVKDPTVGEHHVLFSMADKVTIEGFTGFATVSSLFDWLARTSRPLVTVHPNPQRYGLSTLTEFRAA